MRSGIVTSRLWVQGKELRGAQKIGVRGIIDVVTGHLGQAGAHGTEGPFIITSTKPLNSCLMRGVDLISLSANAEHAVEERLKKGAAILPPVDSTTRLRYNNKPKACSILEAPMDGYLRWCCANWTDVTNGAV
jgi:hypothetical protein